MIGWNSGCVVFYRYIVAKLFCILYTLADLVRSPLTGVWHEALICYVSMIRALSRQ
jgi:hypothetical protein